MHEHKWKFLRTERYYIRKYNGWYDDHGYETDKHTYVYKVCEQPECFAPCRERKEGYWYAKDFKGK